MAYAVAAWILLQLTDVVGEILELPAWGGQLILLALVVGFIPALILAWAFELTPEGIKRESEVDRSGSRTPETGRKLNNLIVVLMAVAIAYLLFDKFSGAVDQSASAPTSTPAPAQPIAAPSPPPAPVAEETAPPRQSIAVLPFDNRSRLEDDEFFVAGIHDDLLTNLARIGALKVISRTSVGKYANTDKTIPEIAAELGVATIMEGAVQRSGNTVRINVQLIDAQSDEHLWAEIFDRELTAENLFAIQSEISGAIAAALETTLSPRETAMIAERPTENLAAYTAYQRGRSLMASRNSADLDAAAEEFQRAVELDPQFALGWVAIAEVSNLRVEYSTLDFVTSVEMREQAVDRALSLNDELGEAYLSLAELKNELNQPAEAEAAYQRALELAPGYASAYHWYANFIARTPARLEEAEALLEKGLQLDPLASVIRVRLAGLQQQMGKLEDAERQLRHVIELDPGFAGAYRVLSTNLQEQGRYAEAAMVLEQAVALDPGNPSVISYLMWPYLHLGDTSRIAHLRRQIEDLDPQNVNLGWVDMISAMYEGEYPAALEHIEWIFQRLGGQPMVNVFRGYLLNMLRDYQGAREAFELAHPGYFSPAAREGAVEQSAFDGCFVGWLLIKTGELERGQDLLAFTSRYIKEELPNYVRDPLDYGLEWCAVVNDPDAAMGIIERRIAAGRTQGWFFWLKHPQFEPLWGTPRFEAAMQTLQDGLASQREALSKMEAEAQL
jgi:TolB-like protein/Flp pilus assembly protein TadD